MKKVWMIAISAMLLLVLCTTSAMAGNVNSAQMGDPGGAALQEILKNVNQSRQPTSSGRSYIPSSVSNPTGWKPDDAYSSGSEAAPTPTYSPESGASGATGGSSSGSSGSSSSTGSGGTQSLDWFNGGQELLKNNKSIKVYDVNTGVSWSARYINGKNHADIIPASQADYNTLTANKITGSYVRRPVIVTIAGVKYAGSMYAVGHGSTSYCTYFEGVMCIHFTGSQTHGSKKVDSDHQEAIKDALNSGY